MKERVHHTLYGYGSVISEGATDKGIPTAQVKFDSFVDNKTVCKSFLREVPLGEESPTRRRGAWKKGQARRDLMLQMLKAASPAPVLNLDFIAAGETHFGKPWHRFSVTVQELREEGYIIEDTTVENSRLHQTRLVSEP